MQLVYQYVHELAESFAQREGERGRAWEKGGTRKQQDYDGTVAF